MKFLQQLSRQSALTRRRGRGDRGQKETGGEVSMAMRCVLSYITQCVLLCPDRCVCSWKECRKLCTFEEYLHFLCKIKLTLLKLISPSKSRLKNPTVPIGRDTSSRFALELSITHWPVTWHKPQLKVVPAILGCRVFKHRWRTRRCV